MKLFCIIFVILKQNKKIKSMPIIFNRRKEKKIQAKYYKVWVTKLHGSILLKWVGDQ